MNDEAMQRILWTVVDTKALQLTLAALPEGVCYIAPHVEESMSSFKSWASVKCPSYELERDDLALLPYTLQLQEYLQGRRKQFELPLVRFGTAFQQKVWKALEVIPYGETRTYSDIASYIGHPNAVRAVGTAAGANPLLIVVPCHRVIGKDGALTGYRGGLHMKQTLLALEQDSPEQQNIDGGVAYA